MAAALERRQQLPQLPRRPRAVVLPRDERVLEGDAAVRPLHVVLHRLHELVQIEALVDRHERAALRVGGRVQRDGQLDLREEPLLVVGQVPDAWRQAHRGHGDVAGPDAQVRVEPADGLLHRDAVVEGLALACGWGGVWGRGGGLRRECLDGSRCLHHNDACTTHP